MSIFWIEDLTIRVANINEIDNSSQMKGKHWKMNRIFFHIQVSEGDLSIKKSEYAMSNDCSSDTKGIDYVAEDVM